MAPGTTVEVGGPPWLEITVAVISLVGVVVTAMVGPLFVERFTSRRTTPESLEFSAIAQLATEVGEVGDDSPVLTFFHAAVVASVITSVLIGVPLGMFTAATQAEVGAKVARESRAALTSAQVHADIAAALAKLPPAPEGPAPEQLASVTGRSVPVIPC